MSQLNERIKKLRKLTKQSQKVFAGSLGISQSHLANLEAGKVSPSGSLLMLICKQFAVNMKWLSDGEGPMTEPKEPLTPQQLGEVDTIVQEWRFDGVAKYTELFLINHRIMARHLLKALKDARKLDPELCPMILPDLLREIMEIKEGELFSIVQRMLQKWEPYTLPRATQESEQGPCKEEHPTQD